MVANSPQVSEQEDPREEKKSRQSIFEACRTGEVEEVKRLSEQEGVSLIAKDEDGAPVNASIYERLWGGGF